MQLSRIKFVIDAINFSGIFNSIINAYLRDRNDRKAKPKIAPLLAVTPGKAIREELVRNGIRIEFEKAEVEIIFVTLNVIRVSWTPGSPPVNYTVIKNIFDEIPLDFYHDDDHYSLSAGDNKIIITSTGDISFFNHAVKILRDDLPPERKGDYWALTTRLADEEHIYGLGERAANLNLRNGTYQCWNTDPEGKYSYGSDPLYIGTPIYLSLSGNGSHLVYYENSYQSTFTINDTLTASFNGGMLRYYVIMGSLTMIYSELAELIGYPNLPPLWSLGYHQCRWGYRDENDIRNVIKGFEEHDIPISVIHLDIDYMDRFKLFSIHPERFPSMKILTDDLSMKGIKVVTTLNPAVKIEQGFDVYKSGLEIDAFCKLSTGKIMKGVSWAGWSVFPDFTNPTTREWWKQQYKKLLDQGIAGIWHDMNEPSNFTAWGKKTVPVSTVHDMEGRGGMHIEAHNIYGLMMNKAAYEAIHEYDPSRRPWIFSRSGWAGLQRYAWNWTGDIDSSWVALQQTIRTIIGLGLSGHAFSGVDIGGFSGNPDAELYTRWFQAASFFPLFRTHSAVGTKPREPWSFGEPTTSIVRSFAKLRYSLLHYYYTQTWKASITGIPPIRPVFWDEPADTTLWDIADEFLLGNNILIAPVLQSSEKSRLITLPRGKWYSFWDDQVFHGPCEIDVPVTLDTIPIFIRAGTLLPLKIDNTLTIHIYPGADTPAMNEIYFDEGDGYGPSRVDTLQLSPSNSTVNISWRSQGEYPFPYPQVHFQLHGADIVKVNIDKFNIPFTERKFATKIFQSADIEITG